ncbi:hypothetical protein JCM11251_000775 [Rhodosporidiobolus azoricus]
MSHHHNSPPPPPSYNAVSSLFNNIKIHLIAQAPRHQIEEVERQFREWSEPLLAVLKSLWEASGQGQVTTDEKAAIAGEIEVLEQKVADREVTVHTLPLLSSRLFTELFDGFALYPHTLEIYLISLVDLYLAGGDEQYQLARGWLQQAQHELLELRNGWHQATLRLKKGALLELERRHEAIRGVPPNVRSAHLLVSPDCCLAMSLPTPVVRLFEHTPQ